jgi:Mn2+/Fe2+ NRAMP family transporter
MDRDYVIFYTEASLICILILLILLFTDMRYGTLQEKQLCFRRAIVAFILYFISDACWAAVLGGVMPRTRFNVVFFNLTNYVILSIMTYEWYMFMAASEHMAFRHNWKYRDLARLPIIVSVLGIVIAYIAKPDFWINADNELNSLYYPLLLVAPVFLSSDRFHSNDT